MNPEELLEKLDEIVYAADDTFEDSLKELDTKYQVLLESNGNDPQKRLHQYHIARDFAEALMVYMRQGDFFREYRTLRREMEEKYSAKQVAKMAETIPISIAEEREQVRRTLNGIRENRRTWPSRWEKLKDRVIGKR